MGLLLSLLPNLEEIEMEKYDNSPEIDILHTLALQPDDNCLVVDRAFVEASQFTLIDTVVLNGWG
jgi:hypothetical protein